ncbi:MAG TPA: 23S rRNA (uracil(1939)-C(5))-methyltransferase RlmD, partial [Candidatus Binatia bacterium]|nr:23S rRNA (uracil(1939)-C(5))-methyltransferase RlmD [Candidatus Binatia bacterium]
LDPPRTGLPRAAARAIAAATVPRVVYVSCDPSTLARDIRILGEGGLRLRSVTPLDLFPQTHHLECVASLERAPNTGTGS